MYSFISLLPVFIYHLLVVVVVYMLSHVWLFVTPWTVACRAPLFMGFSRQEHWSALPFPSPVMSIYTNLNHNAISPSPFFSLSHGICHLSPQTKDGTHDPLHWKRGVLTSGPPGKSPRSLFYECFGTQKMTTHFSRFINPVKINHFS